MQDIRKLLIELQDLKYKEFHSKLCPNINNIIGVRVPKIRKIAKKLADENAEKYLQENKNEYYEEIMLQGMIIGYMRTDLKTILYYLDRFVPQIDNWAICDCCCATYKFTKNNMEEMFKYISKYLKSKNEFELRFAIVMLMDYFLEDDYIYDVLEIFNNIKSNQYYVQMGIAWAISVAYIKYSETTLDFLKNNKLDNITYNKTLQKIIESNRVSKQEKEIFKRMKKKQ